MTELILTLALLRGADATTSCMAFARGGHEQNPLMPSSCAGQIILQGTALGVEAWALSALAPQHPRLTKVLGVVSIGIEGATVTINLRTLRRP